MDERKRVWAPEGIVCGCHPKAILFFASAFELLSVSLHIVYTLNQAFYQQKVGACLAYQYAWLGWIIPWCLSGLSACLLLRCRESQAAGDCVPFLFWVPVRVFSHLLCLSLAWLQLVDYSLPFPAHAPLLLQSLGFAFYAAGAVAAIHAVWAVHDLLREAIYAAAAMRRPPPRRILKKPAHRTADVQFTIDIPPRVAEPSPPLPPPPPSPPRDPIYEQWYRLAATLRNLKSYVTARRQQEMQHQHLKPLPSPPLPPPPPPPRPSLAQARALAAQEYL